MYLLLGLKPELQQAYDTRSNIIASYNLHHILALHLLPSKKSIKPRQSNSLMY